MKLSVLDLVPVFAPAEPAYALEQSVLLAQTAEKLGYSRYWVAEHHDMQGLACTSPEVLLAHIGARTSRIRLGSGALLLPHYRPLKVAETFHTLSVLYPDRIDLGIGRAPGASAQAAIALSGNFLENVRNLPDTLQGLMSLLSGDYECEGQLVTARPVPAVPPQVWMLGTNLKSAAYAAQFGTGYVFGQFMSEQDASEAIGAYRQQFRPSALLRKPRVIIAVGVVCADRVEEAQRLGTAGGVLFGMQPGAERASSAAGKLLAGTGDSVIAQLTELKEQHEVEEFLAVTMIPDYAKRLRSFELLAAAAGISGDFDK